MVEEDTDAYLRIQALAEQHGPPPPRSGSHHAGTVVKPWPREPRNFLEVVAGGPRRSPRGRPRVSSARHGDEFGAATQKTGCCWNTPRDNVDSNVAVIASEYASRQRGRKSAELRDRSSDTTRSQSRDGTERLEVMSRSSSQHSGAGSRSSSRSSSRSLSRRPRSQVDSRLRTTHCQRLSRAAAPPPRVGGPPRISAMTSFR